MLFRSEPLDSWPVGSGRQSLDCFVRVGGCDPAECGTSGEIEQGLLDRGDPPGPEFGSGAFEVKSWDIASGKDHPRLVNLHGRALFGHGDDGDCQGTRDRTVEPGRTSTSTHQRYWSDAIVSLPDAQRASVQIGHPGTVAQAMLGNERVVASGELADGTVLDKPSYLRPRMCIDAAKSLGRNTGMLSRASSAGNRSLHDYYLRRLEAYVHDSTSPTRPAIWNSLAVDCAH